ncbi:MULTISPECIES: alkaline phosphatase D family protein [Nonomuraea]|uniref:Alkaline phosphatase D family protein n=1 Tax=Nonomuraea mangrovi TaxID=2316207 RepID=A0ABW4TAE6_9ACTN
MPNPFTLGVASGEPLPDGVILWTRLTGLSHPVEVRWQLAEDDRFARVVQQGTVQALPAWAHSVHVRVEGLRPATDYFYRFRSGSELSPAGRTRTAPDAASTQQVRFAAANCQRFEHGWFTAYRHLAAERPDVVFHLGDYIYEYGRPAQGVRRVDPPEETTTLAGYRARYAAYKRDPDLQAAHAAAPWVPTWDDHEVMDNYQGRGDGSDRFLRRRAAAYQAYYEHMPLRVRPREGALQMYRRRTYGLVADFMVLDVRQFRDAGTMLGAAQESWLLSRLTSTPVRWRVLVQPLFFTRRFVPGPPPNLRKDAWDGRPEQRARLLAAVSRNLVVLSGDVHNAWAGDVVDAAGQTVGAEFVGSAISSNPPVTDGPGVLAANPHLRYFDAHRGYLSGAVSQAEFRVAFKGVDFVDRKDAPVRTLAEFVTEGRGIRRVDV